MDKPEAIVAAEAALVTTRSLYPEPFASMMDGRKRRRLGEVFGLSNFGVNLTTLAPGATSALRHAHSRQEEFIYIVSGYPTLHTDTGMQKLAPGMCAGFKAGTGDEALYPDDDLKAIDVDGTWRYLHKDGSPY